MLNFYFNIDISILVCKLKKKTMEQIFRFIENKYETNPF